jgi:hypothetical protein
MMVRTFVNPPVTYCSSCWDSTKEVGRKMDAVARKDLRAIFEFNPKDMHVDVADDQYFATDTLRM